MPEPGVLAKVLPKARPPKKRLRLCEGPDQVAAAAAWDQECTRLVSWLSEIRKTTGSSATQPVKYSEERANFLQQWLQVAATV